MTPPIPPLNRRAFRGGLDHIPILKMAGPGFSQSGLLVMANAAATGSRHPPFLASQPLFSYYFKEITGSKRRANTPPNSFMPKLSEKDRYSRVVKRHKSAVDVRLRRMFGNREPRSVYEPIKYLLGAGGKRLRAVLVLLACEAVGGKASAAMDAACAIELLHNFTLVHDDIMDKSDLRRGVPTVHKKWNVDTAILSGDQVVACAYDLLLRTQSRQLAEIVRVFTDAFIEVCEGQGYDKEFENRKDVSVDDYMMMIGKKTARMISASAEIGAIIGGASARQRKAFSSFGQNLGIAFQIQDDILDIEGSEGKLGKAIGNDVVEGKRTFLLLKARERVRGSDLVVIESVMRREVRGDKSIRKVRDIYRKYGVLAEAQQQTEIATRRADGVFKEISRTEASGALLWLSNTLLERQS